MTQSRSRRAPQLRHRVPGRTPAHPLDAGAGVGAEGVGVGDGAEVAGLEDGVVAGAVVWPPGVRVRLGDGIGGRVALGGAGEAGAVDEAGAGTAAEGVGAGVPAGAGTGRTST